MCQNDVLSLAIEFVFQKAADNFVRQMPLTAHDPLFQVPRIGANFQHLKIMARFENDDVTALQPVHNKLCHISQVSDMANPDSLRLEVETQWINGIMRNRKATNRKILDGERLPRLYKLQPIAGGSWVNCFVSISCDISWNIFFAQ